VDFTDDALSLPPAQDASNNPMHSAAAVVRLMVRATFCVIPEAEEVSRPLQCPDGAS
jgi:hypothetical protein